MYEGFFHFLFHFNCFIFLVDDIHEVFQLHVYGLSVNRFGLFLVNKKQNQVESNPRQSLHNFVFSLLKYLCVVVVVVVVC